MEIYADIEQGTDQWRQIRCGVPTASMFKTILANGRSGGESVTRRKYMLSLAGERITGQPAETFSNHHMERGKLMEEEARNFYAFLTDAEPEQIGFIRSERAGCSPDSLIGASGLLEIKTAIPSLLIELILKDAFPPEHKAQTQGQLWVAEREWVDLCVYWPNLPPFIKRAYRDEAYIRALASAVDQFNEELAAVVERISAYSVREAA
jgi:hypothetical protein